MIKTIITEEIDGFQVVKGFYKAIVDPVATRKKTKKEIEADPLMEEKNQLARKRDALLKEMAPKVQALIAHEKKGNLGSPEAKKVIIDLNIMDRQVGDLVVEINDLIARIKIRYEELKQENLTYFEPKIGEEIISDQEYEEFKDLIKNMGPNHKICRDKKIIHDFRKVKYWYKDGQDWNRGIIKKLDERPPEGFKNDSELTPEDRAEIIRQVNHDKIYKMTPEQREAEKQRKLDRAALTAQARIQFFAKGDQTKIDEINQWFEDQKTAIESQYDI